MAKGHGIEKEVKIESFLDLIKDYNKNDIDISDHTLFRLKESQRKVFKDRVIKEIILNDTPILVGVQYNGNYALFYEYNKNILKMIK